jgi:hypothetical protein
MLIRILFRDAASITADVSIKIYTVEERKLIVAQTVDKFPIHSWNQKVHYSVHKNLPLDPILSQMNPATSSHIIS